MSLSDSISAFMLKITHQFHLTSFIEGGTYRGDTAFWASSHFESVISIELSHVFHERAREKYAAISNIAFHQGDTRQVLRSLTRSQVCESLFWLDSHWSGGETAGENDECPILDELDIIFDHACMPFLFIDDARLFLAPPPLPHRAEQWPEIKAILEKTESKNMPFYFFVVDDVIMIGPERARSYITALLQSQPVVSRKTPSPRAQLSWLRKIHKRLRF